jgi:uncharacterized protein YjbJ (UPF0337 family)
VRIPEALELNPSSARCVSHPQKEDLIMGSTADKVTGYANEAAGAIKKNIGKVVGSDEMEVKGGVQQLKGEAQVEVGKAKDAVKDGANKAADEINKKL